MLIVPNACMAFGEHPKSVGAHREIRHVETLVLVCGNNKKSPISSTKLHKIKTAERTKSKPPSPSFRMSRRILSFAQRAISPCPHFLYAIHDVTPIVVAIAVSMLISN